jgi:hypothetical protein
MKRGHPKHETNSKPSELFCFKRMETPLQRELQTKLLPLNPPRPRTSKRKDGWGSESLKKSCIPDSRQLDLPSFNVFFDSLSMKYDTKWESESKEPIERGPETLALDLPLFHDYFGCLQFNFGRKTKIQDEW